MFKIGIWNNSTVCAAITFSASSNYYNNKLLDTMCLEKPDGTTTGTEAICNVPLPEWWYKHIGNATRPPATRFNPAESTPPELRRTHNTGSRRPRPRLPLLARRFARAKQKFRAHGDTRRLTNRRRRRSCPFLRILEHPTRISLHKRLTRHSRRSAQR